MSTPAMFLSSHCAVIPRRISQVSLAGASGGAPGKLNHFNGTLGVDVRVLSALPCIGDTEEFKPQVQHAHPRPKLKLTQDAALSQLCLCRSDWRVIPKQRHPPRPPCTERSRAPRRQFPVRPSGPDLRCRGRGIPAVPQGRGHAHPSGAGASGNHAGASNGCFPTHEALMQRESW